MITNLTLDDIKTICSLKDNKILRDFLCEHNFVKMLEDTELVIMHKMPEEEVDENNLKIYYLANAQVHNEIKFIYDRICPDEFGCLIHLPGKDIEIATDNTIGNTIQNEFGVFNEKLYSALKEDAIYNQFIDYLNMIAESIRIKIFMIKQEELASDQNLEDCEIADPLHIGLFAYKAEQA